MTRAEQIVKSVEHLPAFKQIEYLQQKYDRLEEVAYTAETEEDAIAVYYTLQVFGRRIHELRIK